MAPESPSSRRRAYKTFGWQGLSLTVPEHWTLVTTRGGRESGYVRLADSEMPRLEVRWEKSDQLNPPSRTVDKYLSKLRKSARKEGTELEVHRDLRLAAPPGKDVECYRWVGEQQAVAMLSRCTDCLRSVHVQLLGGAGEQLKSLARTVLASLQDHAPDGWDLWKFLDVEFKSPAGPKLKGYKLHAGCIRMPFKQRGLSLEFVRVSLAEVLLSGASLREWFLDFYEKQLRRRAFRLEERTIKSHPGLMLEGRARLYVNPLAVVGRRRVLRAACWRCEQTNRLMICAVDGLEGKVDLFCEALESFKCCERG